MPSFIKDSTKQFGLCPTGTFKKPNHHSEIDSDDLLELELSQEINWPYGRPPLAIPKCGFQVYVTRMNIGTW